MGTAANTASKAWYTVADGTLSDVYAPTIDNTDVKSLDPIVTGPGFTALQPRDMTYTVASLDATGMACQITALDAAHHFKLVTDFITDPAAEAVVMRYRLVPLPGAPGGLHLYLRFNPLLNGHGGGARQRGRRVGDGRVDPRGPVPLSYSTNSFTEAVNRSYATPIYAALAANSPFTRSRPVSRDRERRPHRAGRPARSPRPRRTRATATWCRRSSWLGGAGQRRGRSRSASADRGRGGRTALTASAAPFDATYAAYQAGWRAYDARLRPPGARPRARAGDRGAAAPTS